MWISTWVHPRVGQSLGGVWTPGPSTVCTTVYGKVWREDGGGGGGHEARSMELLVECHGKMRRRNADCSEQCKQAGLTECCHAALKSLRS